MNGLNGITGTGQQPADIRGMKEAEAAQREEERKQGVKGASEKEDSLSKPRYDEYIPERKESLAGGDNSEKCKGSTDKVDREIKKLKEKKAELERKLSQEEEGTEEWERVQKQLKQAEAELERKDNDSYRRQHAEYQKF